MGQRQYPVADLSLSAVRLRLMVVICPSTAVTLVHCDEVLVQVDRVAVGWY